MNEIPATATTVARRSPAGVRGPLTGFSNLLGKEVREWWRTRRLLATAGIFTLFIAGLPALQKIAVQLKERGIIISGPTDNPLVQLVSLLAVASGLGSIAVLFVVMGAVVGEKERGTAGWILSKPVSRLAFLLAKFVAYGIGVGLALAVLPMLGCGLVIRWLWGPLDLGAVLRALPWLWLSLLYPVAVSLLCGVVLRSQGAVAAATFSVQVAPGLLKDFLPRWLNEALPGGLGSLAASAAMDQPIVSWSPVYGTLILIALCLLAAWQIFERQEL